MNFTIYMNLIKSFSNFLHSINSLWYFYYYNFWEGIKINCPWNLIPYEIIFEHWIWLVLNFLVEIGTPLFIAVHIHCYDRWLISREIVWIPILIKMEILTVDFQNYGKNGCCSRMPLLGYGCSKWFLLFYQIFVCLVSNN